MNTSCLKKWELSLLLALCISLCLGLWAQGQQKALASSLIRLHVVAGSDSPEDQAFKLRVRDRVLEILSPTLEGVTRQEEAGEKIRAQLPALEEAARALAEAEGRADSVTVSLEREHFPTRDYDTFSLPAGDYLSLRVVLDAGQGQNWWCVVFPPLCLVSAQEAVDAGSLSREEFALITEEGGYMLKFRLLELWDEFRWALAG